VIAGALFVVAWMQTGKMDLDNLKFMQGNWVAERGTGVFEETWMPPAGKSMMGMSRTIREGKTSYTEFMMIEEVEGKIKLTICQKLGGPAITLNVGKLTDTEVVFEPVDDPNKATITYRLVDKELHATVSGSHAGDPYTLEFAFKKKP
jgi:hypothetical protein